MMKSDEEEEMEEDEDAKDGSNSESDDGFGVAEKAKKKSKTTLRRQVRKGTVPPNAEPVTAPNATGKTLSPADQQSLAGESTSSLSKSRAAKPPSSVKMIAQAAALQSSLEQVSVISLWQSPQKAKDLDVKIQKAFDKCTQLDQLESEEAKKLSREMHSQANMLSSWVDFVNHFKTNMDAKVSSNVLASFSSKSETICKLLSKQPLDLVKLVLIDLGKVLMEAGAEGQG